MKVIVDHIKWIMIVSGCVTCSMLMAAMAPKTALGWMFDDTVSTQLAELIVRSWGCLIGIVGLALIYGASRPEARRLAIYIAVAGKAAFVGLFLTLGQSYVAKMAVTLVFDSLVVIIFMLYLWATRRGPNVAG